MDKIYGIMNKIGETNTCSPWHHVASSDTTAKGSEAMGQSKRSFGAKTFPDIGHFPDRQGVTLQHGDYACDNGGHCVFKAELVGLFETEDIQQLLDPNAGTVLLAY